MATLYQRRNAYRLAQRYGRRGVIFLKNLGQDVDPATGKIVTHSVKYLLDGLVNVFEMTGSRARALGRDPSFMQYGGLYDKKLRVIHIDKKIFPKVDIAQDDRFIIDKDPWGIISATEDRDIIRAEIINLVGGEEVDHG